MKILLKPHRSIWADCFNAIAERIHAKLPETLATCEHVGSTAVPNLVAKPIIDLMPGIYIHVDLNATIEPMVSLGFRYVSRYEDLFPERRFFQLMAPEAKEMLPEPLLQEAQLGFGEPLVVANVHLVHIGSSWWERHVAFRDHLRSNDASRLEYEQLKLQLANQEWESTNDYADAKSQFIQGLERKLLGE